MSCSLSVISLALNQMGLTYKNRPGPPNKTLPMCKSDEAISCDGNVDLIPTMRPNPTRLVLGVALLGMRGLVPPVPADQRIMNLTKLE